ncbi:MAG: hypothetical protein ACREMO_03185 [Gemmatimonadales bacterium]
MSGKQRSGVAILLGLLWSPVAAPVLRSLAAQTWNRPEGLTLVRRGMERRQAAQADSSLRSYRSTAHGFVFFLAQVGEGFPEPPRLVKADELRVEVYWRAPDLSKQIILGWRDGSFLPTEINYHRDHLGIVTNNFGSTIRVGEGDEVRDAVHPLSPEGLTAYDFALVDSVVVRSPAGALTLARVLVRPRSYARPLVVGTLYLDLATAELVRFRFSFTPHAYLDPELEDISIVLENSLFEGRYWLPYRQEIEIRRRSTWVDFPARGIIRGRWEIGDYELNTDPPPGRFQGPVIGGLVAPAESLTDWAQPLVQAIGNEAAPLDRRDIETLRGEVERIAGAHTLNGLPAQRLGAASVSDLIHVDRVQGLTFGFGGVLGHDLELRPSIGYGTSDQRLTGGVSLGLTSGPTRFSAGVERRVRDVSDLPVMAPVLNSLLAQETGNDHGDYFLLESAALGVRHQIATRLDLGLDLSVEDPQSLAVVATPAHGHYRPNPPLGAGRYTVARLRLERTGGGVAAQHDLDGALSLDLGSGALGYSRATAQFRWLVPAGSGSLLVRSYLGTGSAGLPAYRSFVLGGRGTLLGEPFRRFGGRHLALAQAEWRMELPFPAIALGSFASTGRSIVLAPFVAAGWSDSPVAGTPWAESDGVRPVAGLAAEWFMRLLRVEAGVSLRTGRFGVTIDVTRDWWKIL